MIRDLNDFEVSKCVGGPTMIEYATNLALIVLFLNFADANHTALGNVIEAAERSGNKYGALKAIGVPDAFISPEDRPPTV